MNESTQTLGDQRCGFMSDGNLGTILILHLSLSLSLTPGISLNAVLSLTQPAE